MNPVVLDTNVIVAGFLSRHGAAASLLDAFFGDHLQLAFTDAIIREYAEVLARPELPSITPQDRHGLLLKLHASAVAVVPAPVPAAAWPDRDDLPFVAAALATERKVIVTLNPRDFAPAVPLGLRILSPAEARRVLL